MRTLILFTLLSGCAATMVNAPGGATNSRYAPTNEASRGGVIKYLNQGADFVIQNRREDAYKQMFNACNGKYKIDAEGPQSEGGMVLAMSPGSAMIGDNQYWYIQFSCQKGE
jgi:hypothetical protein